MTKQSKTTLYSGANKIIFFGSGPVATSSLNLLKSNFVVEAVITKPSTLSDMQAIIDCPVIAVNSKTELDNLLTSTEFSSQVAILIDFGIIVSRNVIDYFKFGIINSHFSLLPEWRGADPISFAILSGQKKTGVSLMLIDDGMDTGKIICQKSLPISEKTTTPELTDRLVNLSYKLLVEFVPKYINGETKPRNQPHVDRATYSRKLTKDDGVLDFTKPAEILEREIRAFVEWPKSRTNIAGQDVVILQASVDNNLNGKPGQVYITEDKKIGIHTKQGSLIIEMLKPAGKNAMTSNAFLAGYGHKLEN